MKGGFSRLLPKSDSALLRAVIVLLVVVTCLFAIPAALGGVASLLAGKAALALVQLGSSAAMFLFAWGLWTLRPWARSLAKFFIGALILIGIAGVFNPFYVSDYAAEHGGATPDWTPIVAIAAPLVALGLFCFWVLDRYNDHFGTSGKR